MSAPYHIGAGAVFIPHAGRPLSVATSRQEGPRRQYEDQKSGCCSDAEGASAAASSTRRGFPATSPHVLA